MATYLDLLLLAVKRDAEFQIDLHFLFKVPSSGKLILENYLQFQKMSYSDKKKEKPIGAKRKRNKADNDIFDELIESILQNLLDEITDVKKEISKFRQLAFKHKFSLSFDMSTNTSMSTRNCL